MQLHRLGVKFFVKNPSSVEIRDLISVFHSWIQKQIVENHLLVDFHDYSHVYRGPGILLVAQEGNFSMDLRDNRLGLLYYRKQPISGSPEYRLKTIFRATLQVCQLIETQPELEGRVHFKTNEMLIVANDRLAAPNTEKTFAQLEPVFSKVLRELFSTNEFTLTRQIDPKGRFAVAVQGASSTRVKELLARLSGASV